MARAISGEVIRSEMESSNSEVMLRDGPRMSSMAWSINMAGSCSAASPCVYVCVCVWGGGGGGGGMVYVCQCVCVSLV